MDNIIEIKNLTKSYGKIIAVDDISFCVERGSMFAFLGLNGAGKSTTINILCTLLRKDCGTVMIDGFDLDKSDYDIKKNIGIVFQNSVLDEKLSVKSNLTIRASYYGLRGEAWEKRLKELTDMLSFEDLLKRPFGKLSGGQKRRIDIARGLINCPKLLFLDEPTTGLDPSTRRTIWDIIKNIRLQTEMTVFLTTHYMEESNEANNVVIIDKGKIIANDSPNNLKTQFSGDYIKLYRELDCIIDEFLTTNDYIYKYENDTYIIKVNETVKRNKLLSILIDDSTFFYNFEVVKGNMDDVFLNATGKILEV